MALPQSALSELLEVFRTGQGVNLIQDAVEVALQEMIELEATAVIGADRYERTDGRKTERNGSRARRRPATGAVAGTSRGWPPRRNDGSAVSTGHGRRPTVVPGRALGDRLGHDRQGARLLRVDGRSRAWFMRFAADEKHASTPALPAECTKPAHGPTCKGIAPEPAGDRRADVQCGAWRSA